MKANSLTPSLPLQFPSPIKLPPPTGIRFPSSLTPKAISISTPNTNRISINKNDDDSIAAFWDYQFLFISQRTETENPAVLRLVDGAIPPDFPSGTYYLTGPGMFSDDHGSTVHPLDGHGYLRAFVFEKDEVAFMAKYVKTEAKMEEHDPETDRWRFTHRGPFSVLKGGKKLGNTKVMKNVANTSVLRWGGRLLCLWEGGDPYEIRPEDLDTVGKFSAFDGGGDHDSPSRGGTYDGGFWRFAAELLKPVLYGAMGAITGVSPMISALSVNTNKSTSPIYLIPRFGEDSNKDCKETIVEVPSRLWVLHVGNAFEIIHEEDGYNWQTGKLDPSVMNPNETKSKQFPHLVKVCISLSKNGKCEKCSVEPLSQWPKSSDFPIINPKFSGLKHNYLYAATSSGNRRSLPSFPFDMIVKLDAVSSTVRTWFAGNRRFVGEPVFVPKGDEEDDGYLLVVEVS
ncbi:carotenoid cleavage dioxygenase 7 [Cucumis melo var. makuwa]|uniref:Carotenoid cleavage dioxygenase 7 n=1 Tax=Cucumis melo var. makuwa TaxID=1194695 RepID=A0A5D3DM89_CUCMM|nr:carotenoid cleavage dioxygenase 7 [Cucumis melo var. makuwa]